MDDCTNCDGRKCMDCVLRYQHDYCVDDCPDCCPPSDVPPEPFVTRQSIADQLLAYGLPLTLDEARKAADIALIHVPQYSYLLSRNKRLRELIEQIAQRDSDEESFDDLLEEARR
jgi:hypothetical protein